MGMGAMVKKMLITLYLMSWEIDPNTVPERICADFLHNKIFQLLLQGDHEWCSWNKGHKLILYEPVHEISNNVAFRHV